MLVTWLALFVLGALTAYQHLVSLKSLILRYISSAKEQSSENARAFRIYWWVRQGAFLLVICFAVLLLKKISIPFLLGIISFEIFGKKFVLHKFNAGEKKI